MKEYIVIYTYADKKFGFQNSILLRAYNEEDAIEEAKKAIEEKFSKDMMKNFSFDIKN